MCYTLFTKIKAQIVVVIIVVIVFFSIAPVSAFADVAVVANKGIGVDSISSKQAKRIWMGKTKSLAGTSLNTADLPKGNDLRSTFYKNVVQKSEKRMKAYWAKIVFSGKGTPPKVLKSDSDVIEWVASTPGAVGYVDSGAVNESVKVLLIGKY